MAEISCTYRSQDGKELVLKGDSEDSNFVGQCEKLTGREAHNFGGRQYYPYYQYYTNPVYYYGYPYQYYYYPNYPFYNTRFYGGWRGGCAGGC